MRIAIAALAAALGAGALVYADLPPVAETPLAAEAPARARLSLDEIRELRETIAGVDYTRQAADKPGNVSPASFGDDSCQWANDGECDEPEIGTGACPANTDATDCRYIRLGETDDCQWARDGECDEPGFGTGACPQGSDVTDCGDVTHLRFRDDSCPLAFNGSCDEASAGGSGCEPRTDRTDCVGRARPSTINDHFFGSDDRRVMPTDQFPWSVIGEIRFESGGACTATLIAEDVIATASHCVQAGGNLVDARGVFRTGFALAGGPRIARVTDYLIDPNFDDQRFSNTDEIDGTDWALLRLDTPLGAELGYITVRPLVDAVGPRRALETDIYQAGYSWDTGENLSGNVGCRIIEAPNDNTMSHTCDTTRGDSGSPFMWREGDTYYLMGTDSNFRSNPDGPFIYIAVRAEAFAPYVDDFIAGRIGQGRPMSPEIIVNLKPGMAAYDEAGGAAAGGFDGDPATPKRAAAE